MDAADVVRVLAEPDRLKVFSALALGAGDLDEVVRRTGLGAKVAAKALGKLREAGLADGFSVRDGVLKQAARAQAGARQPEDHGYADPAQEAVIRTFFRDGKLAAMPAAAGKRRLVLEHIAQSFSPGERFPEREVDAVLRAWTDGTPGDHATLRRHLVDAGLLTRDAGAYWRSGAWVDVLSDPPVKRG
ncbi:DUF2087 domain-containing protein [Actinokineospora pegani]|uniref:DUF2087 domain-containing protein n=1 Tax=Actinokineospora pegani TaxID=2654637 RepID=UPI0012EA51D9|nr:DUF2087 domain-containing protein [Actinokineospora pegani]